MEWIFEWGEVWNTFLIMGTMLKVMRNVRMLKIDRGKDYEHQNDNEGAGYDLNLYNDDDYQ